MRLQLKCSCGAGCREWGIIELQGSIEIQQSELQGRLQNLAIGALCKRSAKKFFLTIGYHELEGEQIALKKPLLVFKTRKQHSTDGNAMEVGSEQKTELQVVGIIRHKLLFQEPAEGAHKQD